jgi:hypothetical protein
MEKSIKSRIYSASVGVSFALASCITLAGPSYLGPSSVPKYHPLCLSALKGWQEDGGALDMKRCAYEQRNAKVSKTSEGAYFAKRLNGEPGYMAYKPIGTLDDSMELLLVYDKLHSTPITSIYFIGRIPEGALTRDYLTSIESGGDRCLGGVNSARLISPSELEVEVNATVNQMLTFTDDKVSTDMTSISFKPNNYQAFACAGTITKKYDLITNKMTYSRVAFTRDESRKVIDKSSRCYDKVVSDSLIAPRVLDMQQYQSFLETYESRCGRRG